MKIQIKMHSQLDAQLRPDMTLICQALSQMRKEPIKYNPEKVDLLEKKINDINELSQNESEMVKMIKQLTGDAKEALKIEKAELAKDIEARLDNVFMSICDLGGRELYNYTYDRHFNHIVAGLMGSTCYMKETFKELEDKRIRDIRVIANTVEQNGHHSTFGHSHLTLEITGIAKALAMVINNEKEYCASEKSARYTIMDNLDKAESDLFYKWKDIFEKEIQKRYGDKRPFFDANGVKIGKLAQENARYMLSVFTPTNMVYTTSYRQFNYICHWFEDVIKSKNPNSFYGPIIPQMKEFVEWFKENNLYSEKLEDGKERSLSLFGEPLLKTTINSDVYAIKYNASFSTLAQKQRHRSESFHISEVEFEYYDKKFYCPPIIKGTNLEPLYYTDIKSVASILPQGTLVPVVQKGSTSTFLLEAWERVCVLAQKEVRDLTQSQCREFARALDQEISYLSSMAFTQDQVPIQVLIEKKRQVTTLQKHFDRLSKGARCTDGYHCASPCKFGEGISLESLV